MKRVIYLKTYYQIILAFQMINTLFQKDETILMISDDSIGSKEIAEKIKKFIQIKKVMYVETAHIFRNRSKGQIRDILELSLGKNNRYAKYIEELRTENIDEMICFNRGIETFAFFNLFVEKNPKFTVSFMEEGILSYNMDFKVGHTVQISNNIRKWLQKKTLWDCMNEFYCYYPTLYKGCLTPVQVPRIKEGSVTANILREIFKPVLSCYKRRYIFFTSVYDFEGGEPIGEYELVCKVAELVGKNNLIVKVHPRDARTIYADNGFNVDENSAIPWEIIQISNDFSDKVFLTVNSGSVLAGSFMSEKPVHTFYMYKLCNISGNPVCQKSAKDIKGLLENKDMKGILSKVSIVDNLEEIIIE